MFFLVHFSPTYHLIFAVSYPEIKEDGGGGSDAGVARYLIFFKGHPISTKEVRAVQKISKKITH